MMSKIINEMMIYTTTSKCTQTHTYTSTRHAHNTHTYTHTHITHTQPLIESGIATMGRSAQLTSERNDKEIGL